MTDKFDTALDAIHQAYVLLPTQMGSKAATTMLIAIALQESLLEHRWQVVNKRKPNVMGPARSFWQFEVGGLRGVFRHRASAAHAQSVARTYQVKSEAQEVHEVMHMEQFDGLSAAMARLLLWTDAADLPDNAPQAFDYYQRNWRPGAYDRGSKATKAKLEKKFLANYAIAADIVQTRT